MADLTFNLGCDPTGAPVTETLSHLLIGGATGSGKTWLIDSICTQLDGKIDLLRFERDDAESALEALREAVAALRARYKSNHRPLVIVIDEFAPLMRGHAQEVDDLIRLIALQVCHAGIHLILATQMITPEVVTGTIKACIPSRIAFRTANAASSRALLDRPGAESLTCPGNALFYPIQAEKPIPVHVQ